MPLTGRTHQLRAHCAAMGWPIVGDGKYGGKAAHPSTAPKGLMLHAREIDIPNPAGGRLHVMAEAPPNFREGLHWMGLTPEPLAGHDAEGLAPRLSRPGIAAHFRMSSSRFLM